MNSTREKARNAILGAIIGDAFGTTFEFMKCSQAQKFLSKHDFSNGLPGGGPFNLKPGQFTDDTELGLANMSAIHQHGYYNQEAVAKSYNMWYMSNPFDIGTTTRNSVAHNTASKMMNAAKTVNATSMSNGSLMRLFGLVAMHYAKPTKELIRAVREDISLTHGHPEMMRVAIIYSIMLMMAIRGSSVHEIYNWGRYLANYTKTEEDVICDLVEYGKVKNCYSVLFSVIYDAVDHDEAVFKYNGHVYEKKDIDGHAQGFVGFAIWLLLDCLKNNYDYLTTMHKIACCGGDVDSNCTIVGAVMGALHGESIPKSWIDSVLNCKATERYQEYPIADPAVWTKWLP